MRGVKRLLLVPLLLVGLVAACGDDDDDTAAGGGSFCDSAREIDGLPDDPADMSADEREDAREQLDAMRDDLPDDLADVDGMDTFFDVAEKLLDAGDEFPDLSEEEMAALEEAGPAFESYLADECGIESGSGEE